MFYLRFLLTLLTFFIYAKLFIFATTKSIFIKDYLVPLVKSSLKYTHNLFVSVFGVLLFIAIFLLDFAKCVDANLSKKDYENLDVDTERIGWKIELSRISLNLTTTQIGNEKYYENFSNSRLSASSQLVLQAYSKLMADYYANSFVFFNSLLAEYGQTVIFATNDSPRISNKTLDRILLSTGYTHRIWKLENTRAGAKIGGEIGPFASLSLQSEFTPSPNLPYRKKYLRLSLGARLFDSKYIQNLHINLFGEDDFSDIKNQVQSMGLESGIQLKYSIRDGVDFASALYYRQYLLSNYPKSREPSFEMELNLRLDTLILQNLSISPFLSLYLLKGKYIERAGTNLFVGISLSYGKIFKDNKLPIKKEPVLDFHFNLAKTPKSTYKTFAKNS